MKKRIAAENIAGIPFVSTNDILISHFCNAVDPRVCRLVMDMRNRTPLHLTDFNAGGYQSSLLLDRANYLSPTGIRKCLNAGVPYTRQTSSTPLPRSGCFCRASGSMAIASSWASFPFNPSLKGVSRQVLHLPLIDTPETMDAAYIFKPQPGTLGLLYIAKRFRPEQLSGLNAVLGQTVDDGIFPQ